MSSSVTRTPVSVNSKLGKLMRELDSEEDEEEMIKTTRGSVQRNAHSCPHKVEGLNDTHLSVELSYASVQFSIRNQRCKAWNLGFNPGLSDTTLLSRWFRIENWAIILRKFGNFR